MQDWRAIKINFFPSWKSNIPQKSRGLEKIVFDWLAVTDGFHKYYLKGVNWCISFDRLINSTFIMKTQHLFSTSSISLDEQIIYFNLVFAAIKLIKKQNLINFIPGDSKMLLGIPGTMWSTIFHSADAFDIIWHYFKKNKWSKYFYLYPVAQVMWGTPSVTVREEWYH